MGNQKSEPKDLHVEKSERKNKKKNTKKVEKSSFSFSSFSATRRTRRPEVTRRPKDQAGADGKRPNQQETHQRGACSPKHTASKKSFSLMVFLRARIANMPASVQTLRMSAPCAEQEGHEELGRQAEKASRGQQEQNDEKIEQSKTVKKNTKNIFMIHGHQWLNPWQLCYKIMDLAHTEHLCCSAIENRNARMAELNESQDLKSLNPRTVLFGQSRASNSNRISRSTFIVREWI